MAHRRERVVGHREQRQQEATALRNVEHLLGSLINESSLIDQAPGSRANMPGGVAQLQDLHRTAAEVGQTFGETRYQSFEQSHRLQ